jgi:hypothetical protein
MGIKPDPSFGLISRQLQKIRIDEFLDYENIRKIGKPVIPHLHMLYPVMAAK